MGLKSFGRRRATFTSPEGQVITHAILNKVTVCLAMVPRGPLAEVVLVKR